MKEFYVYLFKDPRNNEVFYIGKGKEGRIEYHFKEYQRYLRYIEERIGTHNKFQNSSMLYRIHLIKEDGFNVIVEKAGENLSDDAAYVLEEILIERFGRLCIKTGQLLNVIPGGRNRYEKIILSPEERVTIEEVESNYPELLPILIKYPDISTP